jgi:Protein of unknown function (DUF732)
MKVLRVCVRAARRLASTLPKSGHGGPNWRVRRVHGRDSTRLWRGRLVVALLASMAAVGGVVQIVAPPAHAVPAPEVEYLYNVLGRRHFSFPNNDALGYGHGICDKVSSGESYALVMRDVKSDVRPNDEAAANYLVSYAVGILCPDLIWRLRNSAANYQPPAG